MITFKEQFDKITVAYIKGEIKPYKNQFCFCGTLDTTVNKSWSDLRIRYMCNPSHSLDAGILAMHIYTGEQYREMEKALLNPFDRLVTTINLRPKSYPPGKLQEVLEKEQEYEDLLFTGMCAAIEVMREIHIKRGEIIDEETSFQKRQLQTI